MITQGNIIHFITNIRKIWGTEAQVLEGILKAQDQECLAGKAAAENPRLCGGFTLRMKRFSICTSVRF